MRRERQAGCQDCAPSCCHRDGFGKKQPVPLKASVPDNKDDLCVVIHNLKLSLKGLMGQKRNE